MTDLQGTTPKTPPPPISQYSRNGDAAIISALGSVTAFGVAAEISSGRRPVITMSILGAFSLLQLYKKVFPEKMPLPWPKADQENKTSKKKEPVPLDGLYKGGGRTRVEHWLFPSISRKVEYTVKVNVEGRSANVVVEFGDSGLRAEWITGFDADQLETPTSIDLHEPTKTYDGDVHGYGMIKLSDIYQKGDCVVGRFYVQGLSDQFGISFITRGVCRMTKIHGLEKVLPIVSHTDDTNLPIARTSLKHGKSFAVATQQPPRAPRGKRAAVLSVFKNRRGGYPQAIKEVDDMEKQLGAVGYRIWRCEEGGNSESHPPVSTSLAHIEQFNNYFQERKEHSDLDGVFIMIIAHGCTDSDGKTKLELDDGEIFDIEDWLTIVIQGTKFPVICCVNSCRVIRDLQGDQELSFPRLKEMPKNIFLSWGSAAGEYAEDGNFVDTWRKNIAADFFVKNIEEIAIAVEKTCKSGRHYSGLDRSKVCKGGIWDSKQHHLPLPSRIDAGNGETKLKLCVKFAKDRAKKDSVEYTKKAWYIQLSEISDFKTLPEEIDTEGQLQGKLVLVVEEDSFAVMCCEKRVVRGILYSNEGGNYLKKLVDGVNNLKITDPKATIYHSQEEFLKDTEAHKDSIAA